MMQSTVEDKNSILKLSQLYRALKHYQLDLGLIEEILKTKGDINYKVSNCKKYSGSTALHFTLFHKTKKLQVIQLLLKYGAEFTIKNDEQRTVLHEYLLKYEKTFNASWGLKKKLSDEIVNVILSQHVKRSITENPSDRYNLTHYHIACVADDSALVELFLKSGVPVDSIVNKDSPIFPLCTPLHIAVRSCALEVVKILLKYNPNLYTKDKDGMTAMHWIIKCNEQIVDLLSMDEDSEIWFSKLRINQKIADLLLSSDLSKFFYGISMDEIGLSGLHVSCATGNAADVKELLKQGIEIDHQVNKNSHLWPGNTALHFAAYFNLKTAKMLMEKGANLMIKNSNRVTPFDILVERYSLTEILSIISTQAKWSNIRSFDGQIKLLDVLSELQDVRKFSSFLVRYCSNINASVSENPSLWPDYTPLHLAVLFSEQIKCRSNYTTVVKKFLNYTVVQSIFSPNLELIDECLKCRADVCAEDLYGSTPLHLAFHQQKTRIVKKLLGYHDSTVNPVDNHNLSHLHIACASENEGVVEKLLLAGANRSIDLAVLCDLTFHRRKTIISIDTIRIPAGSTALHIAVAVGNCKLVGLLINQGANVNAIDDNGVTPIHRSLVEESSTKYKEISKKLLSANLTNVIVNGAGISHLHVASFFDNFDAVKRLLKFDIKKIDARLGCESALNDFYDRYLSRKLTSMKFEDTALHTAVRRGSRRAVNLLINRGADILAKKFNGECPLYSIVLGEDSGSCLGIFIQLLTDNDDIAKRVEKDCNLTTLHLASYAADRVLVKELKNKANVNAQINQRIVNRTGWTAFHMLILSCHLRKTIDSDFANDVLEIANELLKTADFGLRDSEGNTPLQMMFDYFSPKDCLYQRLLKLVLNRIDIDIHENPVSRFGISYFYVACLINKTTIVNNILMHKTDVNAAVDYFHTREAGSSALHLIFQKKNYDLPLPRVKMIDLLLKNGADINAGNSVGDTVLHRAARFASDRVDVFERLFESGADPNKLNIFCKTPFTILLLSKEVTQEVIKSFIDHGYCVNEFSSDDKGCLALPLCDVSRSREDRAKIFEALLGAKNIAESDIRGRTALHNIVSVVGSEISRNVSGREYRRFVTTLCSQGCDIDSQDKLGRTALHLAAHFANDTAIIALLKNGADINIVDNYGMTALACSLNACECQLRSANWKTETVIILYRHTKKLEHLMLHVNEKNRRMMEEIESRVDTSRQRLRTFLKEVSHMSAFTLREGKTSFSLSDLLSKTNIVDAYPFKASIRQSLDTYFINIDDNLTNYGEVIGLVKLQIRKAKKRMTMIDPATESLRQCSGFLAIPEICNLIFSYLNNYDLESLISATHSLDFLTIDAMRSLTLDDSSNSESSSKKMKVDVS